MQYTAEDIQTDPEVVWFSRYAAERVCREHGTTLAEFICDTEYHKYCRTQITDGVELTQFDMADILNWLGY